MRHTPAPPTGRTDALLPSPAIPGFCCAVLVCGVFGLLPQLVATVIAITTSSAVYGAALLQCAWRTHRATRSFDQCRFAGILGLAVLGAAATVLLTAVASQRDTAISEAGLFACTGLFLGALPLLPGTGSGYDWLRRTLDGMSVGAAAMFVLWVLVLSRSSSREDLAVLSVALLASGAVPVTLFGALASARRQPAAGYCHAGGLLIILGLAEFTAAAQGVLVEVPVAGVLMIFGPVLTWYGTRMHTRQERPVTPPPGPLPGWLRALPLVVSVVAVLVTGCYQLYRDGTLDSVALAIGTALLVLLAFREVLAQARIRAQAAELRWLRHRLHRESGAGSRHPTTGGHRSDPDRAARQPDRPLDNQPDRSADSRSGRAGSGWSTHARSDSTDAPAAGQPDEAAQPVAGHHLPGPVTRRRLLAEVRLRMPSTNAGALLVVAVRDPVGSRGTDTVTDVQLVTGTAGLAAPLGDGRYLVLVEDGPARAGAVAIRLVDALAQSFPSTPAPVPVPGQPRSGRPAVRTVSVGVAELAGATSPAEALDQARQAQERAARLGTGIEWYDEYLAAAEARRQALRRELPRALVRDEFAVLYRPIVDVHADRPIGAQAVLRWANPELGVVPPAEFLPVAHETGVISALGEWFFANTFHQLHRWLAEGIWLMMRVEQPYLSSPRLLRLVEQALATHQIPAGRLVVETTEESVAADEALAVEQLAGLRALGARTCLAEAGNGALPMVALRRLPLDLLTIAIWPPTGEPGIGAGEGSLALANQLAHRYGVELLTDGVGTPTELARVRASGCRLAAGPVFGGPLAAERFEALLRDYRSPVGPVETG